MHVDFCWFIITIPWLSLLWLKEYQDNYVPFILHYVIIFLSILSKCLETPQKFINQDYVTSSASHCLITNAPDKNILESMHIPQDASSYNKVFCIHYRYIIPNLILSISITVPATCYMCISYSNWFLECIIQINE